MSIQDATIVHIIQVDSKYQQKTTSKSAKRILFVTQPHYYQGIQRVFFKVSD